MSEGSEQSRELTWTRIFEAPREMVWKAWTDPEIVARWWGPKGVTNPTCEVDARPGGKINIVMLAGKELGPAEGQKWPMRGTFKEVIPESRLVIVSEASDDVQGLYIEHQIAVDLEEIGGKTRMVLHISITKINKSERSMAALKGMEYGWVQTLEKLAETLEK